MRGIDVVEGVHVVPFIMALVALDVSSSPLSLPFSPIHTLHSNFFFMESDD